LMRAEKLVKKARKAKLLTDTKLPASPRSKAALAKALFELAASAQKRGWSAEALLRSEAQKQERALRKLERKQNGTTR